jgi:hypothetical protein
LILSRLVDATFEKIRTHAMIEEMLAGRLNSESSLDAWLNADLSRNHYPGWK